MPELPEVETTLRGIAPYLTCRRIERLIVRERRLRYPIAEGTEAALAGQSVHGVRRRGKYLLLQLERGGVLVHLGMSGSLRVLPAATPPGPHDHLDLCLSSASEGCSERSTQEAPPPPGEGLGRGGSKQAPDLLLDRAAAPLAPDAGERPLSTALKGERDDARPAQIPTETPVQCLRLRDPRRFGLFLWTPEPLEEHPLIRRLGPEPLGPDFDGDRLYAHSRGRRTAVKAFIMESGEVVGVGNIYANESLYRAGIHPARACGRIGLARYRRLAAAIREVLAQAIEQGGTSLRDFVREDGSPGYFAVALKVYGRAGEPCPACGEPVRQRRIGQRSSYFCPRCQR